MLRSSIAPQRTSRNAPSLFVGKINAESRQPHLPFYWNCYPAANMRNQTQISKTHQAEHTSDCRKPFHAYPQRSNVAGQATFWVKFAVISIDREFLQNEGFKVVRNHSCEHRTIERHLQNSSCNQPNKKAGPLLYFSRFVAASIIFCSVASARANSPVNRPSHSTKMRSQTVRSSGSSLEVTIIASPSRQRRSMRR